MACVRSREKVNLPRTGPIRKSAFRTIHTRSTHASHRYLRIVRDSILLQDAGMSTAIMSQKYLPVYTHHNDLLQLLLIFAATFSPTLQILSEAMAHVSILAVGCIAFSPTISLAFFKGTQKRGTRSDVLQEKPSVEQLPTCLLPIRTSQQPYQSDDHPMSRIYSFPDLRFLRSMAAWAVLCGMLRIRSVTHDICAALTYIF